MLASHRSTYSDGTTHISDLSNTISKYSKGVAAYSKLPAPVSSPYLTGSTHYISAYIVPTMADTTVISASGLYYHQETTLSVTPSISGVSMSAGISLASSSKFHQIKLNPYVTYNV